MNHSFVLLFFVLFPSLIIDFRCVFTDQFTIFLQGLECHYFLCRDFLLLDFKPCVLIKLFRILQSIVLRFLIFLFIGLWRTNIQRLISTCGAAWLHHGSRCLCFLQTVLSTMAVAYNEMIISALTVDGWTAINLQLWVSDRSHYGTDRDPLLWTEAIVLGEWRTLTLLTFVLIKQIVQKFHQVTVSLCCSWFIVKCNDTEKIGFINS